MLNPEFKLIVIFGVRRDFCPPFRTKKNGRNVSGVLFAFLWIHRAVVPKADLVEPYIGPNKRKI